MVKDTRILIYAPSVRNSGGRALLESLVELANPNISFYLPAELEILNQNKSNFTCRKGIYNRLRAEATLKKISKDYNLVLMFGNLPPIFSLRCKTCIFIQNKEIFSKGWINFIQRTMLKSLNFNYNSIYVQTHHMKELVSQCLPAKEVDINCFLPANTPIDHQETDPMKSFDFIYVATGVKSKNHLRLIKALKIVKDFGINPSICFTLDYDKFPELKRIIDRYIEEHGLNISNVTFSSPSEKENLYKSASALIHPSYSESLCLPLFEAKNYGIEVLASELDHVREILDPIETFDPYSETSIARAILRYFNIKYRSKNDYTAHTFINKLIEHV